jgi:hypothetical protein
LVSNFLHRKQDIMLVYQKAECAFLVSVQKEIFSVVNLLSCITAVFVYGDFTICSTKVKVGASSNVTSGHFVSPLVSFILNRLSSHIRTSCFGCNFNFFDVVLVLSKTGCDFYVRFNEKLQKCT